MKCKPTHFHHLANTNRHSTRVVLSISSCYVVPWAPTTVQRSTFNIHATHQVGRITHPMSARGDDGIKCQRGLLRPQEGTCPLKYDVRHLFNVVPLPCRIRVDNPRRFASQCEFLMPFIRECVLQVTVCQITYHFLAIHQKTANSMTRCRPWFAISVRLARCSFKKERYMRGRPRNASGELLRSFKR